MSDWTQTYNAVFFLSGSTILCGGIGVVLSYCFKSKCAEFGFCGPGGCFYIKRNVEAENVELQMELDHTPLQVQPPSRRESIV